MVDAVAGTTVDPVDSLVEIGGEVWRSSTPPACAGGSARPAAPSTTPACAPPRRSRRPRWRSCCSTPPSRSASRTSGSSPWWSRPAGPWSRLQQVGPARRRPPRLPRRGDRTGAARMSPGRPGSTSRRRPAGRVDKLAPALRDCPGELGNPDPDRHAQRVAHRAGPGHPAPGARWRAPRILFATQAGVSPAALRAVHHRSAGRRLPALRRAPAPRGLRLRGQPDRDFGTPAQEGRPGRAREGARLSLGPEAAGETPRRLPS